MTAAPLAEVIALHPAEPRHLAFRLHDVEPPHVQAHAHLEWVIEQQLTALADAGQCPDRLLDLFAPAIADRARGALDVLFDAAQAVHDRETGVVAEHPLHVWLDAYADALFDLAEIVRGAA